MNRTHRNYSRTRESVTATKPWALPILAIMMLALLFAVPGGVNAQTSDDATLSALTVAPKDIIGFDADLAACPRNTVGQWSGV